MTYDPTDRFFDSKAFFKALSKKRAQPKDRGRPAKSGSMRLRLSESDAYQLKRLGGATGPIKGSEGFREAMKMVADYLRRHDGQTAELNWPADRKSYHVPYNDADRATIKRWLLKHGKERLSELQLILEVAHLLDMQRAKAAAEERRKIEHKANVEAIEAALKKAGLENGRFLWVPYRTLEEIKLEVRQREEIARRAENDGMTEANIKPSHDGMTE